MKKFVMMFTMVLTFVLLSGNCFALQNIGIHLGTGSSIYTTQSSFLDTGVGDSTLSRERANMLGIYFDLGEGPIQIQPEVNYIHDTFDLDLWGQDLIHKTYQQIQIPILLKANSPEFAHTRMYVMTGPYASILIGDRYNIMERYDYGYIMSAGFEVFNRVTFEARHQQGVMNITNVEGVNMKNSRDMFVMGFNFI